MRIKKLVSGNGLFLAAALLGLLTAAAAFMVVNNAAVEPDGAVGTVERALPAVVALEDIPAGARLMAGMVEVRDIPEIAVIDGTAARTEAVIGRVTRYPLLRGEQIAARKLVTADETAGAGLAFSVPRGMRAVAVPLNEVRGAGGNIVAGDRVDVLVHTDYQRLFGPAELRTAVETEEKRHPTVVTVLQDVLVLAVAQQIAPPADSDRDEATLRPEGAQPQPQAASVTLAVTPDQAQSLFFASQEGVIGLALRSFGDTTRSALEPLLQLDPKEAPASGLTAVR